MRIGVMGTGAMAAALGGAWARAGHEVFIGGRDTAAAATLAAQIGAAGHGTPAQASTYGEAVLLAVPAGTAPSLARQHAGALTGRTVVDCTNALVPGPGGVMLTTDAGQSVAGLIAAAAPAAHVVKAFNLVHVSHWHRPPLPTADPAPAVPFCTDDTEAAAHITELITATGWTPIPSGGLDRAPYLEATAAWAIGIWWSGNSPHLALPDTPPPA
ncbi:NADPH-dependent F420 reductase [Streptomyces sp. NPDC090077]|uniref:NADPH-dependent F420 reductase n=1 Tax=Streptomyces sp. NPDC090077 TaxID=3365938 RepID=UPI00380463B3